MKQTLAAKDGELRQKQREIDRLYGKLAAGSPLTDAELRQQLQTEATRLMLTYAFRTLHLHNVMLKVDSGNERAI